MPRKNVSVMIGTMIGSPNINPTSIKKDVNMKEKTDENVRNSARFSFELYSAEVLFASLYFQACLH